MAALQFTPGPKHLFALFRNASIPSYLGTCVTAPKVEAEKFKIPIMNDLSGRSVPFQLVQDGENHLITATLNRYDITVMRQIRALESGVGGVLGQETGFARGTLVIGVSDFQLIVLNGYANTAAAGSAGAQALLELGRRYYSTTCVKYSPEDTEGTRLQEVPMAFRCENIFNSSNRGFALYSESDMAGANLSLVT